MLFFLLKLAFTAQAQGYFDVRKDIPAAWLNADRVMFQAKAMPPEGRLEDLLKALSARDFETFQFYSLVRNSGSIQVSSPTFPRAIVYGTDARLLQAFNGHPDHAGYDRLELIQFREPKPGKLEDIHYEFREVIFHSDRIEITEPDPAKCARCHGTPLRPIWEAYDVWEGLYGKRDDAIIDPDHKYQWMGDRLKYKSEYVAEWKDFQKYLAIRGTHPRYSLLRVREGSPVAPYGPEHRGGNYYFRPNLRLTFTLVRLHRDRVLSQAAERPACFRRYRELLQASLLACPGVENFRKILPKLGIERRDWHLGREPKEWYYYEGAEDFSWLVATRLWEEVEKDVAIGKFSRLAESLARARDAHKLAEIRAEAGGQAEGEAAVAAYINDPLPDICAKLAAAHEEAKKATRESDCDDPPLTGVPLSVRMCRSCHDGSEANVPRIAIERGLPAADREKILGRITTAAQKPMPPTRSLSDRERREIRRYLESSP